MPTGIDQSWGYADPAAAARAGVQVVSMYLSGDPSKNATASKIRAYHAHGIGVLLNWEAFAGAPLNGAGQGRADATEAVRQVRTLIAQVGYAPKNKLAVPFSCDKDVTRTQFTTVGAYYGATRAVVHAAGFLNGVYAEASLVSWLHAKGLTDMEWQTVAWSGGVISADADFYQNAIDQTLGGASVDFDQVIHAGELGAWWPPTHPLNVAAGPTDLLEQIMALDRTSPDYKALVADVANAVWSKQLVYTQPNGAKTITTAGSFLLNAAVNANKSMHALTDPAGALAKVAAKVAAVDPAQLAADTRAAFAKLIGG